MMNGDGVGMMNVNLNNGIPLSNEVFDVASLNGQVFKFEKAHGLDVQYVQDKSALGNSTDLCTFFFNTGGNACDKGALCQYRHARNDRLIVCKHWLRGLCKKGEYCEYLHEYDMSRMPECYFFSKFGECSNAECMYRHVDLDKKRNECPYYARGFCKHGPKCRHRHVKRVACPNYLAGFCKDGPECMFGHARFEITRENDEDTAVDRFGFGRPKPSAHPNQPQMQYQQQHQQQQQQQQQQFNYNQRPNEPYNANRTPIVCHGCGQSGHIRPKCPLKQ